MSLAHSHPPSQHISSRLTPIFVGSAAADILHRQGLTDEGGLEAMLRQADWAGPKGAHPYTPADEIEGAAMGELLIDNLD